MNENYYFKPMSITWWSGLISIGAGIALVALGKTSEGIQLITTGVGMIGIRGAVGEVATSQKETATAVGEMVVAQKETQDEISKIA